MLSLHRERTSFRQVDRLLALLCHSRLIIAQMTVFFTEVE